MVIPEGSAVIILPSAYFYLTRHAIDEFVSDGGIHLIGTVLKERIKGVSVYVKIHEGFNYGFSTDYPDVNGINIVKYEDLTVLSVSNRHKSIYEEEETV